MTIQVQTPAEAVKRCGRRVYIAVDIGGTNTRVALQTPAEDVQGSVEAEVVVKVKSNVMAETLAFLHSFQDALSSRGTVILAAAVAGPGPRNAAGDRLGPFANYTSAERVLRKADLPPAMFPPASTVFLNDLEAAAYGITSVSQHGQFSQFFTSMWGPRDASKMHLREGPYLVLAVGTGCGVGLIHTDAAGGVKVLPLEFGHTTIAPMPNDADFLKHLGARLYGKGHLPEYEDIVAGRGLVSCYQWMREEDGNKVPKLSDPGAVAQRASQGCQVAREALLMHYKYLMRLASDLTMGFVLGGVIIAGDNIMHNAGFVTQPDVLASLRETFLYHTMERFGFQSRVDVIRQTRQSSLNLEGAFYKAREAATMVAQRARL